MSGSATTTDEGRDRFRIVAGGLSLDLLERRAVVGDRPLRLSPLEFGILALVAHHAPAPLPRATLLGRLWDLRHDPGTNLVEVHLCRLRAKLRAAGGPAIETMPGAGWRLRCLPEG